MSFLSRQPGEPATSHLSSNNPFRNRAVSPSLPQSPTSPFADPSPSTSSQRPVSRNPFLDPNNDSSAPKPASDLLIDLSNMSSDNAKAQSASVADIFSSLSVEDKTTPATKTATKTVAMEDKSPRRMMDRTHSGPSQGSRGPPLVGPPPRAKNIPPRRSPSAGRHSSRSPDNKHRQGRPTGPPGPRGHGRDGSFNRRPPVSSSRPRRNSESSIADHDKAGERSHRDDRRREQSHKERSSQRPNRRNDIIDQMDATSIFGTVFHHDGPFDALNPHRNRKGSRRAPMQAFPKDSLNNVLGGSGPLNKRPDHKTFMGQGEDEAFTEFASREKVGVSSSSGAGPVFDPLARGSVLHGDQSLGLGTSTFLEGTPATRTAIQRREQERIQDGTENNLQRKKSLAQRFRSINRGPRDPNGRAFSTDGTPIPRFANRSEDTTEHRPFDEFDASKGDDIITVRRKGPASPTSPSSPPSAPLERRSTADAAVPVSGSTRVEALPLKSTADEVNPKPAGSGLLARVKSLKGGRRAAPPPPPVKDV